MSNRELIGSIEAKLFQIESMAKIAMDNINYKNAGYDEPFISNLDMANLMWAITDLADEVYQKVDKLELKEDANHG